MFDLLLVLAAVTIITYYYLHYITYFEYWKKKKVPTPPPKFPAGNITKAILGRESLYVILTNCYKEFKAKGHKHAGLYFFNGPVYVPIDLEIIKAMFTTDFEYFSDRVQPYDESKYPLTINLFTLQRSKWKPLRTKLTPTFSPSKMKIIYNLFLETTEQFNLIDDGDINIKEAVSYLSTDIITSTVLGVKGKGNEFLSEIMHELFHPSPYMFYKNVLLNWFNRPEKLAKAVQNNQTIVTHITNIVRDTLKHRESDDNLQNDFLSFLLAVQKEEGLTFNEILGTFFSFFVAGHDTASSAITWCLHELAYEQDIQDRLRQEILENLGPDVRKFQFEDVLKLNYLDKVFNETLRLHPPATYYQRICVKPYKVPGTDVIIDKDTPVLIPILGLHCDPDYYPDPFKFDPERFEDKDTVVPGSYLPFGKGPRLCIGIRYGTIQVKLTIAALLSKYKFTPSNRTPRIVEFDQLTTTSSPMPKKGIWVKVKKLES